MSKSSRGRESVPSTPVAVPLEAGSSAPGAPVVTNSATDVTITWTPSPDARTATFLLPPSVKPTVGANATLSNATPKVLPPLTAKSLGFNTQATTYHVYDVNTAATPVEPAPYAIKAPSPITPAAFAETAIVIKRRDVRTGACFEVRPRQVFAQR